MIKYLAKSISLKFSILAIFTMSIAPAYSQIIPGAERMHEYLPIITRGKSKVGVVCNHSSMVGNTHLIDTLMSLGIDVKRIFVPEHGFRGDEDAGSHVSNDVDPKTGLPIISLYGDNYKPSYASLKDLDYLIFDIQDVGVRFFTYISTLQYVMESAAETGVFLIILDRPNPNGHYIDGPVLEPKFSSFVGMQPIPVVYGMTIGEYANFLKNEDLLLNKAKPKMKIVPCHNYSHKMKFSIKIPPSPNLKSDQAISLYPSLCLFEGTNVSVGRGTDRPFEMFGSPYFDKNLFTDTFTPLSRKGATEPQFKNKKCYGLDLKYHEAIDALDLTFLIIAYKNWKSTNTPFFTSKGSFFDKLAGTDKLRKLITQGKTKEEIKYTWRYDLASFNKIRKRNLLYEDFEDIYNH